jgi:hypothetical protein
MFVHSEVMRSLRKIKAPSTIPLASVNVMKAISKLHNEAIYQLTHKEGFS